MLRQRGIRGTQYQGIGEHQARARLRPPSHVNARHDL